VPAVLITGTGAGALVYGLWSAGRHTPRTVYHQEHWRRQDWLVLIGSVLVLGAYLLPIPIASVLDYSPYPLLTLPPFDPFIGILTLGLLVPALIKPVGWDGSSQTS
jgi:hypothetical protein